MKETIGNPFRRKKRADEKEGNKHGHSGRKVGTRVLLRVVALVVVVLILSSSACFLFFRNSQKTLIEKSKDQLVEYKVGLISSPNAYLVDLMTQILLLGTPGATPQTLQAEIARGVSEDQITPVQKTMDDMLEKMINSGLFDYKLAFFALPPESGITTNPEIIMSSDPGDIYQNIPDSLTGLVEMSSNENTKDQARIDDQNSYMLAQDGIPELGLEGEILVNAYRYRPESSPSDLWYFSFSSIQKELAAIDAFYSNEQRRIDIVMYLVMIISALALIIITYFLLSYLIRKRITKPIDELSNMAAQVIEGDVDVQVPVTSGEEFEGLKNTFNELISSLRMVINKSVEESPGANDSQGGNIHPDKKAKRPKNRGRSSILIEITALVVTLFIITGGIMLLICQRSQSRMIQKSKEKIIQSEAETICSGHNYVSTLIMQYYNLVQPTIMTQEAGIEFLQTIINKETGPVQATMSSILRNLKEKGLHGIDVAMDVFPKTAGIYPEYTVFAASDDDYLYITPPGVLLDLYQMPAEENEPLRARVDKNNTYMFLEDGIPEMGLEGEYLVTTYRHSIDPSGQFAFWFFDFRPMHEDIAAIDNFYSTQSRNTLIVLGIVISISIIMVFIITFFYLSFLIRKEITRPVDELAAAALEVTNGNIEIQVPVNKGEELEDLKNAFNTMLKSLNDIIERSIPPD